MLSLRWLCAPVFLLCLNLPAICQQVVLAATPPMGWNTWNHFKHAYDDKLIREEVDAIVTSGMKDAGYVYINLDGGWENGRDADGNLKTDPNRFPDMKALGDYIHSKGLKFGIYSSPTRTQCDGGTGSFGHEEQDAQLWASWGVDYLKYDVCDGEEVYLKLQKENPEKAHAYMIGLFTKMHLALLKTGRPIVYSVCQYGLDAVWRWGAAAGGNLWRTTSDIRDGYSEMSSNGFTQAGLARYAGPGHWNDPDMLEIGNGGMKIDAYKTQISLWAILAAPLIASNDVRTIATSSQWTRMCWGGKATGCVTKARWNSGRSPLRTGPERLRSLTGAAPEWSLPSLFANSAFQGESQCAICGFTRILVSGREPIPSLCRSTA
jgi:alpha-galactosidase